VTQNAGLLVALWISSNTASGRPSLCGYKISGLISPGAPIISCQRSSWQSREIESPGPEMDLDRDCDFDPVTSPCNLNSAAGRMALALEPLGT
jgi:hypothetical protein